MSYSPPPRRLSIPIASTTKREEDLINAYEAEEERLVNIISRKLEKLREEKIDLENTLEAESEAHVNRLSRELSALRLQTQQLQQANANGEAAPSGSNGYTTTLNLGSGSGAAHSTARPSSGATGYVNGASPMLPSADVMLDAMRRENEELRGRLAETEQAYVRASRLNEVYREELIEHRRRLGIAMDDLIGMSSYDPFLQPTHRRASSSTSPTASRPSTGSSTIPVPVSAYTRSSATAVPIHRPPSQIHRPAGIPIHNPASSHHHPSHPQYSHPHSHSHSHHSSASSTSTTPSFNDSPDSASPYALSPVTTTHPTSYLSAASAGTALTTPPSSASLTSNPPAPFPLPPPILSYPSVPPPSLSSSFGSPSVSFHAQHAMGMGMGTGMVNGGSAGASTSASSASNSPVDPLSRRNSLGGRQRRGSFERRLGGISEGMHDSFDAAFNLNLSNLNGMGAGAAAGVAGSGRGVVRSGSSSRSRGHSFERANARVAETGSLLGMRAGRGRAASDAVPEQDPLEGESMPLG